jgi:MFS transporter, ACS family, D-galactonate transporter
MSVSSAYGHLRGAGRISPDGIRTVALVVLCQVAHFLTLTAIPLLLPVIREDLEIGFTQAGMLSAAGMLSYALAQIPAGYLSDRFGPRRLFLVGLVAWSLLCIGFGLIHAFWLALATLFVAGAFRALLFAPGLALLASWFPAQRRATAMSLFTLGVAGGSILLSLAGPFLANRYGWRATFIVFAIAGLGAACLYGACAKDEPRSQTRTPPSASVFFGIARFPILWVCSWLQFVRFAVVMGFNFWLPSFLMADRGFSLPAAGVVMALSAALSAPSNTLGAYISDRLRNPPLVIGGALSVPAGAAAMLPTVESTSQLLAVIALYSIFQGFYFGPLFLVPVEVLGNRVAGTTIGFSNLFANIGGFACVYTLGVVRDQSGSFAWGFLGIAALCLVGVVLAVLLSRMRARALGTAAGGPSSVAARRGRLRHSG